MGSRFIHHPDNFHNLSAQLLLTFYREFPVIHNGVAKQFLSPLPCTGPEWILEGDLIHAWLFP